MSADDGANPKLRTVRGRPPAYDSEALLARLNETREKPSDLGNARRLVALFRQDIRYCPHFKRWLVWRKSCWVLDEVGQIQRYAKLLIRVMHLQAAREKNEELRKSLASWALASESVARINAMIEIARTEPGIPILPAQLDADRMLLGVLDGVVDLRTRKLRGAMRQDYITKQAPVHFDPDAVCPIWERFIDQVTNGDKELANYLQRTVGYCLTGLTNEQCIFIVCGPGANGKSVFLKVIEALLGDYARATPAETLLARRDPGGPSPDLARLQGIRLVLAYEPSEGSLLAEDLVKRITGQDTIVCRRLYQDFFEYDPQFTFFLATNHKPIIRGDDHAIWRRIRLIPFTVIIPDEQQDKELEAKLLAERPGILNWALEGLRAYQEKGLEPPSCVVEATREYRSDMDIIGDWIADCAVESPGTKTLVGDLYSSYHTWCRESGHHPFSKKRFSQRLKDRGFEHTRTGKARFIVGLALKQADQSPLDRVVWDRMGTA